MTNQVKIYRASVESVGGYGLSAYGATEAEAQTLLGKAVRKFAHQNRIIVPVNWREHFGMNTETVSLGHAFVEGHDGTPVI